MKIAVRLVTSLMTGVHLFLRNILSATKHTTTKNLPRCNYFFFVLKIIFRVHFHRSWRSVHYMFISTTSDVTTCTPHGHLCTSFYISIEIIQKHHRKVWWQNFQNYYTVHQHWIAQIFVIECCIISKKWQQIKNVLFLKSNSAELVLPLLCWMFKT